MAKKENEGVFSSYAFSEEENEKHDAKINAMSKKKLVQLIYGMGNVLDKDLGTTEVTEALQSLDQTIRRMYILKEKSKQAEKCLKKCKNYRKNLLMYHAKMRMKKAGTKYLKNKCGTVAEFAKDYAKVIEKIKEKNIAKIKSSDYEGYISRARYRVKKPKKPFFYKSIEEIPYDNSVIKESGLEYCDKMTLKWLIRLMLETRLEGLSYAISFQRRAATTSSHDSNALFYISKDSLYTIEKRCEYRLKSIEKWRKRCGRIEEIIDREENKR